MRRDHTRNLKFLYGSNRVGVVPPITSLPCAGWTRSLMPGVFFVAFLSLPIRLLLNVGSIHPVVVWASSAPKSRAHRTRSLLHSSPRRHRVRPPVPGTLQWLVHGTLPESPAASSLTPQRRARRARHTRSGVSGRSEEHTSELQSLAYLVCRLLLEKKKKVN